MHAAFAWQRTKGLNRISQKALLLAVLCVLIATFVLLYCLYCSEWGVNPFRPDNLNGEDLRKNNKSLDTSFVFQACATKLLECAPYCLCIQSFALVVALSMPPLIEKVPVLNVTQSPTCRSLLCNSGGLLIQHKNSLLGCGLSRDCVVHTDWNHVLTCLGKRLAI